jgi:hypothetical protein
LLQIHCAVIRFGIALASWVHARDQQGAGDHSAGRPRRLGIEPGSEVDFVVDDDTVRLVRRTRGGGAVIVDQMRGRHRLAMSTDEIMALTRADA